MLKPEVKPIALLAAGLMMITALACLLAWWLSPQAGLGLFALFGLAWILIGGLSWWWLRQIRRQLASIQAQLHAARTGVSAYDIAANDEGAFSSLNNELYHYVRQTAAMRSDLQRDRNQLTVAITDIAHQLRTPIAVQTNLTELLTAANLAETKTELRQQNQRLAALVNQLITLAKVDTHTLSQSRTTITVDALLRQSIAPLLTLVADQELELAWQVDPTLTVQVNEKLMQEALINLLKNTIEHAPKASTVTVQAQATPLSTIITLQNAGPQIPAADLPHLFERFYRGSQSAPNNLGIGLAIAQGIIEAGAGRLTISNLPVGVAMRVELFH